jgi:uncharacterized Zn finger protein (UPF0148 family)
MAGQPQWKPSKNLFGKISLTYPCPGCGRGLRSPLDDAGTADDCPFCDTRFTVPGSEHKEKVAAEDAAKVAAREQAAKVQANRNEAERQVKQQAAKERAAALQAAESEKRERARLAEAVALSNVEAAPPEPAAVGPRPNDRRKGRLIGGGATTSIVVALLAIYAVNRGSDLRAKLAQCESKGVIAAAVSYEGLIGSDTVVFDLREGGSSEARKIDAAHLLMQFAGKLNLYSVKRVVLARNGKHRFVIAGSDLRILADSYEGGGRIWAFNNLPARVRRPSGTQPFGEWTGGAIGVLGAQAKDLNLLLNEWLS